MTQPLVTVVIPNYNYARYLPAAIDSVLDQTYGSVDVLVIDNGSTDDSLDVLRGYGERIRWIQQENRGQAGSRNRGVEESRGDFVAFLDADDTWRRDKLEKQMALFRDERVGLVYCGFRVTDGDLNPVREVRPTSRGDVLADFLDGGRAVVLGGESTALVRRDCFETAGLFDPNLSIATGWDMWRRIASRYRIDFVDEPLVNYRQHGNNANQRIDIWEHDTVEAMRKMFRDPATSRVADREAEAFGRAFLMLSGAYYQAGNYRRSVLFGLKALSRWRGAAPHLLNRLPSLATRSFRGKA